ncbi:DASS family sodium-coupled anion symporter [Lactobacillus mulieris]|uniref:DASS family sodium-coupled anion symporter n=1 Tax=Lactobacillus mulieris TaxID=2508708 RepID=UPI00084E462E|nr:DASS family sodium-coupled anion symporter [Lactobacillus mulieris]OEH66705.1 anion permease [Lactobacillus jensenii]
MKNLAKVNYRGFIVPVVVGVLLWLLTAVRPTGISVSGWHLFAIFLATIIACITKPLPIVGVAIISYVLILLTGLVKMKFALTAFADSTPWMIAMAYMIARGFVKTGLGRRIALIFVRNFGKKTLGLGYSLSLIDLLVAPATPSNTARSGGIVFPLVESLAENFDSKPNDPSRKKMGSFLTFVEFHANLITSMLFLTAMAPNLVAVELAKSLGVNITWIGWFEATCVPALLALLIVPFIIYKMYGPDIKETPNAKEWASAELKKMGKLSVPEMWMAGIFLLTLVLWMLSSSISLDATLIAFISMSLLLLTGVLSNDDFLSEKGGWNVLVWLSILVYMANRLTKFGFIKWLSETISKSVGHDNWIIVLIILGVLLFYTHYLFASATAHNTAMYGPFLAVALSAGAPKMAAAMFLAIFSAIMASTTHYANGPASVLAGSGYVEQGEWWKMNFILGLFYIVFFIVFGLGWMKIIGLW